MTDMRNYTIEIHDARNTTILTQARIPAFNLADAIRRFAEANEHQLARGAGTGPWTLRVSQP